jgi:hypothetical protein
LQTCPIFDVSNITEVRVTGCEKSNIVMFELHVSEGYAASDITATACKPQCLHSTRERIGYITFPSVRKYYVHLPTTLRNETNYCYALFLLVPFETEAPNVSVASPCFMTSKPAKKKKRSEIEEI